MVAGGASGTAQSATADKGNVDLAAGGLFKSASNTHAFTIASADSDGKMTFATDTTSSAGTTGESYKVNVGANMLKVGKNRQILKITEVSCASNVLTFTHETTTALTANDIVSVSGFEGTSQGVITTALTGTLPAITNGDADTYTGKVPTGGSGTGLVVTVVVGGATTLTSVTATKHGTGYKVGDVLTVPASAGDYDAFTYTLVANDLFTVSTRYPTVNHEHCDSHW